MTQAIFSTAYLPPTSWFRAALKYDTICIESFESWQKQSYRNRCVILGANGPHSLNIPIDHSSTGTSIKAVMASKDENWQRVHWQSIKSAYQKAPFFEALADELHEAFESPVSSLHDWNMKLVILMLNWLQVDLTIVESEQWISELNNDYRDSFHPKKTIPAGTPKYSQMFGLKDDFIPNLSIIDLIFNEGPASYDYLVS